MFLRNHEWYPVAAGEIVKIGVIEFKPTEMGRILQLSVTPVDSSESPLTPVIAGEGGHRELFDSDPEWGQRDLNCSTNVGQISAVCKALDCHNVASNGTFPPTGSTLNHLSKTCLLSLSPCSLPFSFSFKMIFLF